LKAIHFHEHGELANLEFGELQAPVPGQGQALIRLQSAALNHLDLWVLNGWPGLALELPHIPGADGAGVIEQLGDTSNSFEVGQKVVINANLSCGQCEFCLAKQENMCREWHLLGETVRGTFAEYVALPLRNLLPIPEGFDLSMAAAAGLVFHTAWHSLVTRGKLQSGQSLLVVGASGGVNTASIQIGRYLGATVYVVGSNASKVDLAQKLGADHVFDRSEEPNWSKQVFLATDKRGVDVVVDNVGSATMASSLRAARKGGKILTVGNTSGPKFDFDNRFMFGKHLSLIGSTMGTNADFKEVMQLIFAGKLNPVLDRVYPLSEARQAYERLQSGEQLGKLALIIDE
jgi:NADPH:quinone reductase-like Zn-dependent oxidoreductase